MSAHAAVFRNDELMAEGIDKLAATYKRMEDVHVSDRSLIWNSDLIETMELEIDADFGANPLRKMDHVFERAAAGALADDERGGFGRCSRDQAAEFGGVAGVHIDRATTRGEQRDEKSPFAQCSDLRGLRTAVEVLDAAVAAIILDHRAGENFPVTPDPDRGCAASAVAVRVDAVV